MCPERSLWADQGDLAAVEKLQDIHLRGDWQDNGAYFKLDVDLKKIMLDRTLWEAVDASASQSEATRLTPEFKRSLSTKVPRTNCPRRVVHESF